MGATIALVDLNRQHEALGVEIEEAIGRVARRSSFTLGEEVEAFEEEFAAFCGAKHAVGVGTGTDALHFALRACGIGPGDEVITAVNTFAGTAEAILMCGAKPVFIDVDEASYLMDPARIEDAVNDRTRAIVPVHLYGQPAEMPRILAIARRHNLKVIEDACQAHGAKLNGSFAGSMGDAGCFSFYPGKNLGAWGDGGMVVTDNMEIAEIIRLLRNHGEGGDRRHVVMGFCSRLHGVQAAILRAKLKHLSNWNVGRIELAEFYTEALRETPVTTPHRNPEVSHVYHLYVVRAKSRDNLRKNLAAEGVDTGIHYPVPLHLEPAFRFLGHRHGDFPVAEKLAGEILSLPMHPYLRLAEARQVSDVVAKWAARSN